MSKPTIKYIDMDKNHLNGAVGTYDNDFIYIYKKLPEINNGSRRLCIEHEMSHYRNRQIDLKSLLGSSNAEENFIEICGIINTPIHNLSLGEEIVKKHILLNGKLKFKKKSDRKKIFERILILIEVDLTKLDALTRVAK